MLAIMYCNETIYHVYTLNFLCWISPKIKMPLSDLIKKHEIRDLNVNHPSEPIPADKGVNEQTTTSEKKNSNDPIWLKIAKQEEGIKAIPGSKHNSRMTIYAKMKTEIAHFAHFS